MTSHANTCNWTSQNIPIPINPGVGVVCTPELVTVDDVLTAVAGAGVVDICTPELVTVDDVLTAVVDVDICTPELVTVDDVLTAIIDVGVVDIWKAELVVAVIDELVSSVAWILEELAIGADNDDLPAVVVNVGVVGAWKVEPVEETADELKVTCKVELVKLADIDAVPIVVVGVGVVGVWKAELVVITADELTVACIAELVKLADTDDVTVVVAAIEVEVAWTLELVIGAVGNAIVLSVVMGTAICTIELVITSVGVITGEDMDEDTLVVSIAVDDAITLLVTNEVFNILSEEETSKEAEVVEISGSTIVVCESAIREEVEDNGMLVDSMVAIVTSTVVNIWDVFPIVVIATLSVVNNTVVSKELCVDVAEMFTTSENKGVFKIEVKFLE